MGKTSKPNTEYAETILNEWQAHGGLMLQSEAARILGVSDTQINNMANKNKLYKVKINGNAYVGYTGLYMIYKKRTK